MQHVILNYQKCCNQIIFSASGDSYYKVETRSEISDLITSLQKHTSGCSLVLQHCYF